MRTRRSIFYFIHFSEGANKMNVGIHIYIISLELLCTPLQVGHRVATSIPSAYQTVLRKSIPKSTILANINPEKLCPNLYIHLYSNDLSFIRQLFLDKFCHE